MKTSRIYFQTVIAAMLLSVVSCANEELGIDNRQTDKYTEIPVILDYTIDNMGEFQTRTIPSDMESGGANADDANIKVLNMWILQFTGNQSDSRLLGAPRFVSAADMTANPFSMPLVQNSSSCYTLFVANIASGANFLWNVSTESTFADIIARVKTLQSESDTYEVSGSDKTLLMSAVTEAPIALGTTLAPHFTRNVAKVTLKLALANANMEILSVRLRNVSNTIVYANAALTKLGVSDTEVYPVDALFTDYNAETTNLPTYGSGTSTFSWYVPRNQRGVNNASQEAKDKTFYAPQGATYFEVIAKKTTAGKSETSVFRVYPGANQTNDYSILSNKHYMVELTVTDIGTDVADSRVETFGDMDYTITGQRSNSFIINPAPAGSGVSRIYKIPISQVNRYWSGTAAGYGNDATKVIGSSDTWVINLIWTDLSTLYDTGAGGITLRANNSGLGLGEGKGPDQWFELEVPPGLPAGNFTLGIKKQTGSGEYLWSWHFWVTDYNPDKFNTSVIADGVYTYPVPGGQVERYSYQSGTLWSQGGAYDKKVMMDRNMGAVETFFTTQPSSTNNSRGYLYYQFGRKDPFPLSATTGNASYTTANGPVTIQTTMTTPNVFYAVYAGNWANEATSSAYIWNDPNANATNKSIYDPCPPGWKMPANGTWNDFNRSLDGNYITVLNVLRGLGWSYGRGIGSPTLPVNGLRYWPGTTATVTTGGTIWYPAAGYRGSSSSGQMFEVGSYGRYWLSSSPNATNGSMLSFTVSSANTANSGARANAFSVRCVAE